MPDKDRSDDRRNLDEQYAALWDSTNGPPDVFAFLAAHSSASPAVRREVVARDLYFRWNTSQPLPVDEYFARCPEFSDLRHKIALLCEEFQCRAAFGDKPDAAEFAAGFPEVEQQLLDILCRPENGLIDRDAFQPFAETRTDGLAPSADVEPTAEVPETIGRYRVERVLGKGGFGLVYLAHDDQLQRPVAIKVPHADLIARPEDAEAYLAEARTVAGLDHPHIIPVYDVGQTDDFPCFVVSKYVEGTDLAQRLKTDRLDAVAASELTATLADALHFAHKRGIVHRDIKPANILIEADGKPYIGDFGLALREQDVGKGPKFAGTPAYMSPEQARGEGHRVDGRSDLFSLAGVLYELLVGRRPFAGDTQQELLEQITTQEARPPRQIDDGIPKELERIVLKALSKRAADRYTTARDFADDLRHFLRDVRASVSTRQLTPLGDSQDRETQVADETPRKTPDSDSRPVRIVPKGLRSFDEHDADFFLELLPGPRDRDGLPDSLRFWKTRIEETDAEKTFSVGLIYGPSGCGKSSLVKAGLLPRLSENVIAVYVEATPDDTESRLLNGLRKHCRDLPGDLGLKDTLTTLRQGQGIPTGKKVLIVLDQFEQWLHAKRNEANTELVQALRQCDGGNVQCVVMVRDDFWLAVTRFLRDLEIDLLQGHNTQVVDLFDSDHARRVLAAFGRAFGRLPESSGEMTPETSTFLKQSVAGLAEEGKVICVRLALFAEMMKGKPWTPATLKAVGGTSGVGVTFLEETFSSQAANPKVRLHQKAARAVLKALLPESGTDIKGTMRSHKELLEASGYANRPGDFDDLIHILDNEIRLITPTDPEGAETDDGDPDASASGSLAKDPPAHTGGSPRYFQLTHDYLVPSLRDWLTRKQRETRRGRAELRLSERSALWNAKPENRHLPALWEHVNIRLFTRKQDWTDPQRLMMRRAARVDGLRSGIVAAVLVLLVITGFAITGRINEQRKSDTAKSMVNRLIDADIAQVPAIVTEIDDYRIWADPLLKEKLADAQDGSPEKLRLSLALLPVDGDQVPYLQTALLNADAPSLPVVRDALNPHRSDVTAVLWTTLGSKKEPATRRFNAACALATFDTDNTKQWKPVLPFVADQLVETLTRSPRDFAVVLQSLEPIRKRLAGPVAAIVRDTERGELQRETALNVVLEYAGDDARQLADVLAYAEQRQFGKTFDRLATQKQAALPHLTAILQESWTDETPETEKERIAKRQANAAVALLKLGETTAVWPLLKHSPDPRTRSYIIHWAAPLGVDSQLFLKRFESETDTSIRRALLLTLGEFNETQLPVEQRQPLLNKLLSIYETDPDPGVHSCAEWLLRKWGHQKSIEELRKKLQANEEQRKAQMKDGKRRWYVNTQGQTFAVLTADVFRMGSPKSEPGRNEDRETPHLRKIGRTFAIATCEVTKAQFRRFWQENQSTIRRFKIDKYSRTDDSPYVSVDWYDAAAYCNWLSKQEGIPEDQWCYEKNADGKYAAGMKAKQNYLELTGYRLPTEVEWEYACRAGATTSRYYGLTDLLLPQYARYVANGEMHAWPVGGLKPNGFGLFDMLGNVYEWCHDAYVSYDDSDPMAPTPDNVDISSVSDARLRLLRGGSFLTQPLSVRSAMRNTYRPSNRSVVNGFRPSRTYP